MIKEISSSEAYGILQESVDAVLIDVRTKMEYEYVAVSYTHLTLPTILLV